MPRRPTGKALTKRLDIAAAALVKASRGSCERCERSAHSYKMDAAHIEGRQNRRLRWDPRNLMVLCWLCHRWWHDYPLEAAKWIKVHRPADVRYIERVRNEITHYSDAEKRDILADLEGSLDRELAA